jgi:Sporulation and spore germination
MRRRRGSPPAHSFPRASSAGQVAVAAILLLAVATTGCRRERATPKPAAGVPGAELTTVEVGGDLTLRLFYPGVGERLTAEARQVKAPAQREELVRLVLQELFAGPSDPDLRPPFPAGVAISDVFLAEDGIAYVDLGAPDLPTPPASGSLTELLEVYSVVDSVLVNVPQVQGVVLLWNGNQSPTFAGHLDTSRPLTLKEDLIAGADPSGHEPVHP